MYKHAARGRKLLDHDWLYELGKIKDAVSDAALDAKEKAGDLLTQSYETAKEKSHDFHNSVGKYARRQPLKTIGLAMVTGLFIGMLVKRRRTNSKYRK